MEVCDLLVVVVAVLVLVALFFSNDDSDLVVLLMLNGFFLVKNLILLFWKGACGVWFSPHLAEVWLSPWGGYGFTQEARVKFGKKKGYLAHSR